MPLEYIKSICVPKDKVELVQNMMGDKDILVSSIDDIDDKFYYFDEFGSIYVIPERYEALRRKLRESNLENENTSKAI